MMQDWLNQAAESNDFRSEKDIIFGEDSDKSVHQSDLWRERLDFEALRKYKFLTQPIIGDLKENNPKENNPHP